MDVAEVGTAVKKIIANVTGIAADEIGDDHSFVDDLQLDSLSLLEIGVDVDYEFKLGVPEERLQEIRTVREAVDLVVLTLSEKAARADVA